MPFKFGSFGVMLRQAQHDHAVEEFNELKQND